MGKQTLICAKDTLCVLYYIHIKTIKISLSDIRLHNISNHHTTMKQKMSDQLCIIVEQI